MAVYMVLGREYVERYCEECSSYFMIEVNSLDSTVICPVCGKKVEIEHTANVGGRELTRKTGQNEH